MIWHTDSPPEHFNVPHAEHEDSPLNWEPNSRAITTRAAELLLHRTFPSWRGTPTHFLNTLLPPHLSCHPHLHRGCLTLLPHTLLRLLPQMMNLWSGRPTRPMTTLFHTTSSLPQKNCSIYLRRDDPLLQPNFASLLGRPSIDRRLGWTEPPPVLSNSRDAPLPTIERWAEEISPGWLIHDTPDQVPMREEDMLAFRAGTLQWFRHNVQGLGGGADHHSADAPLPCGWSMH
ncbi:hypothetical protein A0H81_07900 [Grifola frondosa]|uniref:Uncharacterized protein n=1 Tax=Grifola frondosa TaxID=5627 RepID=A0A1C7M5T9_GRIFR|nr:hypothetical protein A0H81_07900 [Grifola frondosa]